MKILALEFSSPVRSVALAVAGTVVASAEERGERGANPIALIDSVLRTGGVGRQEIQCLAVGLGPGSYAGIRIAIAIAQGWELAGAVKLSGHSSAESVARQAAGEGAAFSIGVDAQRGELFVADYTVEAGRPRLVTPFRGLPEPEWRQLATVAPLYRPDVLEAPDACMIARAPTAATLALMAAHEPHFVPGSALEPVYLRPADFVKAPPADSAPRKAAKVRNARADNLSATRVEFLAVSQVERTRCLLQRVFSFPGSVGSSRSIARATVAGTFSPAWLRPMIMGGADKSGAAVGGFRRNGTRKTRMFQFRTIARPRCGLNPAKPALPKGANGATPGLASPLLSPVRGSCTGNQ